MAYPLRALVMHTSSETLYSQRTFSGGGGWDKSREEAAEGTTCGVACEGQALDPVLKRVSARDVDSPSPSPSRPEVDAEELEAEDTIVFTWAQMCDATYLKSQDDQYQAKMIRRETRCFCNQEWV